MLRAMTPLRIGINGLGRIGRLVLRHAVMRHLAPETSGATRHGRPIEVVAANDLSSIDDLVHLLTFDSVHRRAPFPVERDGDRIVAGPASVRIFSEPDPAKIPWAEAGAEIVLECTGRFTKAGAADGHLASETVRRVIVGAPAKGTPTFVVGVNDHTMPSDAKVVSNASCTTNALVPVLHTLQRAFGVRWAILGTVHAYTNGQALVDAAVGKDPRRQRAAAINIVPTTTGAGRAVAEVLPELSGKLAASAVRVPVPDGSWFEVTATFDRPAGPDEVVEALRHAAETEALRGILEVADEPLVSSDIVGRTASSIVDAQATLGVGALVKVCGWYDNEYAYAARLLDLATVAGGVP